MAEPATEPSPDTWTRQLDELKARYKHVREPVLVALNILLHDAGIALGDAKAQAQMRTASASRLRRWTRRGG